MSLLAPILEKIHKLSRMCQVVPSLYFLHSGASLPKRNCFPPAIFITSYRSKSRSLGLEGDLRAGKCEKVPGDFLSDQKRPMGVFFNFH